MQKIILALEETLEKYHIALSAIHESDFRIKPDGKWSKIEELGHIIDSAENNIQRFIRVQYENNVHIMYHPDNWVALNDYQNRDVNELVELWYLLNKQLLAILQKMPAGQYETLMSFDKNPEVKNTALFIAEDYVKHMTHHLESITE